MLKLKREYFLLFLILFLGVSLKLLKIFDFPLSLDEAIHGLIAFKMIKTGTIALTTGRAYHGPMSAYVLLPNIYLFGKNILAARISILILSIFSVILFYIYVKELYNISIALVASFIFTIIPCNLVLSISIIEFEPLLFFMLLVNYLFSKYNKTKKNGIFIPSFTFFWIWDYNKTYIFIFPSLICPYIKTYL